MLQAPQVKFQWLENVIFLKISVLHEFLLIYLEKTQMSALIDKDSFAIDSINFWYH